jgi:DNA-binding MarR family transcriptional regulator
MIVIVNYISLEVVMKEKTYSVQSSTGYWVALLAQALQADFEKRLAVRQVTPASWAVLSAIQHHGMTTPAAIASFIRIDRASITRHLDRIEEQGLIIRHRSSSDRRSVNPKLTPKGERLVPQLAAESLATNAKFTAGLVQSEIDTAQAIIKKMLSNSDAVIADL